MGLGWQDNIELALLLIEKHPETDPLTVRFSNLRQWIIELPEFDDDPHASNEGILEAIQMAWYDEFLIKKNDV